ncbi:MAG TPA: carboxypeptidase regulatory-like domain-containing protein, partial [Terracidiphilus sp.]|nr:carboxypeptidase regulatory-like domain-containing protein [Terracidiphilus sp.]
RAWHGFTLNSNYTWSRTIDDGGTFRTGYAIPIGAIAQQPDKSYPADRIERSLSTTDQRAHFVLTSVWALPIGKTYFAGSAAERAILGGFNLSGIYQAYSGSPLAITASSCQTNPAQGTCLPTLNPGFSGSPRQNGKWGHGVTWDTYNKVSFITPSTYSKDSNGNVTSVSGPFMPPVNGVLNNIAYVPAYTFSDSPRTAPYNLFGPGNYQLDLALTRSFPLHFSDSAKLNFRAEWYNITNHTQFAVASTQLGNSSFGQVTQSNQLNRKSAQFSARISF